MKKHNILKIMILPLLLTSCQNTSGKYINERDINGQHIVHTINLKITNKCDYIIETYENDVLVKTYKSPVCSWQRYIIHSENNREQMNIIITNPNYDETATNGNKHKTITKYFDYYEDKIIDRSTKYEYAKR